MDDLTKEFLAESKEGLDRMERCLTELETRPGDRDLIDEVFRTVHTIKGATGFLGFGRLEALAHAGENLLGALRAGRVETSPNLISGLLALLDGLRSILVLIETTGGEGQRSSDDDYELIGRMAALQFVDPFGQGILSPAAGQHRGEDAHSLDELQLHQLHAADHAERRILSQAPDSTLRVSIDILDRMMNLAGELVLTRNQILQTAGWAADHPELARRLDSITSELRNAAMEARMQPVSHIFGKFPRMVRDLARVCGRQVRLEFEGQNNELDKTLLEAVRDPLTHAIRNAVDHGIESPEDRIRAGKDPEGVIRLRAYAQNGFVVIEVCDDGAGICSDRVLARATERGLVSPAHAAHMSPSEIMELLFEPGFSTADSVTSISGRGVGLDVVRANVEKVGGSVQLESWPGLGTALRLRMPLTLAIIPALILRSAGHTFALPQNRVSELVLLSAEELCAMETVGGVRLYRVRDCLLPVVRLNELLALPRREPRDGAGVYLAVIETEGFRYALLVDELFAPEEIVVRPISPVLRSTGAFLAGSMLGSGQLALILDAAGLGARAGVRPSAHTLQTAEPHAEPAALELQIEVPLLVYEAAQPAAAGNGLTRFAVPLAWVERIETVPATAVHSVGGSLVIRFGDELLALEGEGAASQLADLQLPAPSGSEPARELTVLICHAPRRAAIPVHRVIEIYMADLSSNHPGHPPMILLNDTPTILHQPPVTMPALEEVA